MLRSHRPVLLAAGLSVLIVSCGSEGEPATRGTAIDGRIEIIGTDQLDFVPNEITTDARELEIDLVCAGAAPHTIVFTATEELVAECVGNQSDTADVALTPGTYEFYCSIPGHKSAGMTGTLTVEG